MKPVFILAATLYAGITALYLVAGEDSPRPGVTPAPVANAAETAVPQTPRHVSAPVDKTVPVGDCAVVYNRNAGIYAENKCDHPINLITCNVRAFQPCRKGSFVTYDKSLLPGYRARVGLARRGESSLRIEACYVPYRPRIESSGKGDSIVACRPPTPLSGQ